MKYLIVIASFIILASGVYTGASFGFTEEAAENFKNNVLPYIFSKQENIQLPNQHINTGRGVFKVTFSITETYIYDLNMDVTNSKVNFGSNNDIILNIADLSEKVRFTWSYDSNLGSDKGFAIVSLADTLATTIIHLSAENGRPVVSITEMTLKIGNLDVKFSGNTSADVANWLVGILNQQMIALIEKLTSDSLKDAIDTELNQYLSSLDLTIDIGGIGLAINYTLPYPPIVTENFIQVDTLGLIVLKSNPNLSPPIDPPVQLPGFQETGLQIQAYITDYTFNSGFYAAYQSGSLSTVITQSDLPSQIKLTTTFLNDFLPGIVKVYGPNKPCQLNCSATEAPVVHTQSSNKLFPHGQIVGAIVTGCSVVVINQGTAVELDMNLDFNATLYIDNWVLNGDLSWMQVTSLKAVNNNIDPIDTEGLMDGINFLLNMTLPTLNQRIFGQGLPLPKSQYVNLTMSDVTVENGYTYIQSTPQYNFTDNEN
ncbi:unnamed protein product [Blepharisma stoltei]|uniref:Lipid-binding serum glycoprotein C-terminal domain-containing protein n=1 Tax=Blepharisma stoltei TaxID=1481888 RepID=A0AAU9JVP0_9CILI|nr:unnamed protein product [Blepharisma stoltei]